MVQRYSLCYSGKSLGDFFKVSFKEEFHPRYNAAPLAYMPVMTTQMPGHIQLFQWGLVPGWSEDDKIALSLTNVRSEEIYSKSPYKQLIQSHRCAVLADGFYEWQKEGTTEVPYRITLSNDQPFAMAGIYDVWQKADGNNKYSFTIITKTATGIIADISTRMPVMLTKETLSDWLLTSQTQRSVTRIMSDKSQLKLSYYKVNRTVNLSDCDSPQCIEPAPKFYPGETLNMFE